MRMILERQNVETQTNFLASRHRPLTMLLKRLESKGEFREKIVFEVRLVDPDKQLKKSDVKGTITKKGSETVLRTKTLSFDSENYEEVTFDSLTADTEYLVEFYTSFNGKKVSFYKDKISCKTSNEGTLDNPYKISTFDEFKKIRQERNGHFKLTADIDCGGSSVSPLFQGSAFTGTFDGSKEDGGCWKIYNFTYGKKDEEGNYSHTASKDQYFGLFGNVGEGAKISNLELSEFNIYVSRDVNRNSGTYGNSIYYYGILAGVCAGTIENVKVTNSSLNVKSENTNLQVFKVGGLVGNLKGKGIIKNVEVDVDINVESSKDVSVGGVAGTTRDAETFTEKVDDQISFVPNISNTNYVGKIAVSINGHSSTNGLSDSKTISQPSIGGLVGKNVEALIKNCSVDAEIKVTSTFKENEGQSIFVGGLVGKNISDISKISECSAKASFEVETYDVPKDENKLNVYVGLFAGQNGGDQGASAEISGCSFTPKGENIVKVYDNENVSCVFEKVAKETKGSKLTDSTLVEGTPSLELTVKVHTKADGSEEYTESKTETKTINR